MIIKCPECGAKNRIPDLSEPTKTYRCGKCRTRLTLGSSLADTKDETVVDHQRVVSREQKQGATVVGAVLLCLVLVALLAIVGLLMADKISVGSKESLGIVIYPNDILDEVAQEVGQIGIEDRQLADLMINTMEKMDGDGLSAPQVGVSRRISIVRLDRSSTKEEILVMVNPKIIEREGTVTGREGCLSIAGTGINKVEITRSERITVQYCTLDGEKVVREESGWNARIIQHEIDHLDGTLISDYASACNITPEIIAAIGIIVIAAFLKMRFVRIRSMRLSRGKE